MPGASEPWSELIRAVGIRAWLSSLEFPVKIQCWPMNQETVLKASHKDWASMPGLGVEAAQISRHGSF